LTSVFDEVVKSGATPAIQNIEYQGRIVHVPKAAKGVAWFTFADLCDEALAAADYLELTRYYRVFIIENVPRLDAARTNEALRFIHLIDVLYEQHTLLAISAAAPPVDLLQPGSSVAAQFARTISRLTEMQSAHYRDHQASLRKRA
jgi:cell division protein ZapE